MEMKEEIISNKIKCKKCGNIIESRSTNDYKRCSCGAVAVDGGTEYLKRIGNENDYIELSVSKDNNRQLFTQIIKKISNTLTSKGISTSNHTVEKYITAYLESYLINKYERIDIKEKIYYPEIINIMQLIQD